MGNRWYEDSNSVKAVIAIIILILVPVILSLITITGLKSMPTLCLFKNLTGRECWGCGMTRAVVSGFKLSFKEAYSFNKRVVIVLPMLVYLWFKWIIINIKTLIKRRRITKDLSYN